MNAKHSNFNKIVFDRDLIKKLLDSGPRYTSYPTADRFTSSYTSNNYIKALDERDSGFFHKPLSLYFHIPFCNVVCYYCGCNKIVTKDKSKSDIYINYLEKELDLLKPHIKVTDTIEQLHFGGGTPTFLTDDQFTKVFEKIQKVFSLSNNGEYSIEIDPRKVTKESIYHLSKLGFNRMSIGVQDFNPQVQQAINRIQSEQETRNIIDAARDYGFKSISVDLIYGLPNQTVNTMIDSLRNVMNLSIDRIALYHYAHLPHLFKPQRRIDINAMPSTEEKLDILQHAVNFLKDEGYIFIGMDHFAKPHDELAIALNDGRLQRNFQGYSTHAECDLIGLGVSSIGKVGNHYIQNQKNLESYYSDLDNGNLPVVRGIELNKDDLMRRSIIQSLMCRFSLSMKSFEEEYNINFKKYFTQELAELKKFEELNLIKIEPHFIWITNKGRFLIRNISMVFDYYLRNVKTTAIYSKTI